MLNNFLRKKNQTETKCTKNEPSLKSPNLQGFLLTPNSEKVMVFQSWNVNSVQGVVVNASNSLSNSVSNSVLIPSGPDTKGASLLAF